VPDGDGDCGVVPAFEPLEGGDGVGPDVDASGPEPKVQAPSSSTASQGAHGRRRVVIAPPIAAAETLPAYW
jgi:hypothetical protein